MSTKKLLNEAMKLKPEERFTLQSPAQPNAESLSLFVFTGRAG